MRMLTVLDEYTRECLAIVVARKLKSDDVLHTLGGAVRPARSARASALGQWALSSRRKVVREWLKRVGVQTLFIAPGSPWENGYNESFNGKFKDELITGRSSIRCGRPGLGGAVAQGVQYDPAAQLAGLPSARSAGDPARSSVAQTARIAGARSGPEGCGQTNLTCGTTLGGRSPCDESFLRRLF